MTAIALKEKLGLHNIMVRVWSGRSVLLHAHLHLIPDLRQDDRLWRYLARKLHLLPCPCSLHLNAFPTG